MREALPKCMWNHKKSRSHKNNKILSFAAMWMDLENNMLSLISQRKNVLYVTAAAAKSLQSCPTLCDPIDGSPPGSPIPGILQVRILEWVAISFSNAWKWKVKVKSLSRVQLVWPHGLQPTRLLLPWDFPGKITRVGCHCLLPICYYLQVKSKKEKKK